MRLVLVLLLSILLSPLAGQDGVFPAFDARSRLLGGTGLAAQGTGSLWTNPAGLAQADRKIGLLTGVEQRFGLEELSAATIGGAYGIGSGGIGVRLASFGFDTYRENSFGLSYGRKLTEKFSLGAEFVGFATATEGYAATFDLTFGIGMQLELIPKLSVAARIFSPLRTERLPDEYLPQLLAIGLQYRPSEKMLLNAEVHQDSEFPLRVRVGLEYLPVEELSVRLGVASAMTELSFGLGYEILAELELTAGAVWHEVLGTWPAVGLRWR